MLPAWRGFEDDDHRREAWEANRAQIMAEWCHPGRRPDAYWELDLGLEPNGGSWRWPEPIQSEEEMVLDLLRRGKLKGCRWNGVNRIESEAQVIREAWLHEVRIAAAFDRCVREITTPLPTWGTPTWFYAEYAPRFLAVERDAR